MKIILERHAYAPELNKAYIGPRKSELKVPSCTSIKEVRQRYFAPLKYTGRHVTLQSVYPEDSAWLNRTRQGFCNDLVSLKGIIKAMHSKLDMRKNPDIKITSKLIG